ncbi:MAG: DUF4974 domain-containing protein [Tepidisphaeraceae bacterium]|jgi:hypothetical protein
MRKLISETSSHFSSRRLGVSAFILFVLVIGPLGTQAADSSDPVSSSALINQALDSQVGELNVQGGLIDVMKSMEAQTGVRLEAAPAVWDALPWGQDTTVTVHAKNITARQALDLIVRRLGLTYRLGQEAVVLEPLPALARMGRRATLQEVHALDTLAGTPLGFDGDDCTVSQVLAAVDAKLKSTSPSVSVQTRPSADDQLDTKIHLARNLTLLQAMEEIADQTGATWYPWGDRLVVVGKLEATRTLLTKRLSRRFTDAPLPQVLEELSEFSGVEFHYAPGVMQQVPAKYQSVTLSLQDAMVEQILETISGATGLKFEATADGVNVTYAGPK